MDDAYLNSLLLMRKQFEYPNRVILPIDKQSKFYKIKCVETKDKFILDYDRRGFYELKYKEQLRHSGNFCLVRLEINAPPHMNPDGRLTSRNHIHIFKEGFELRWAYECLDILPGLSGNMNPLGIFTCFCEYCKIDMPNIDLQGVV